MNHELTLKILGEIAAPGSGHLFSRREAARSVIAMIEQQAARIAELDARYAEASAQVIYHATQSNAIHDELVDANARIAELEAENSELGEFVVAVGGFWGKSKSKLVGEMSLAEVINRAFDEAQIAAVAPAVDAQPVAWALQEQLDKRESTWRGYLWFVDPKNTAWTPLYASAQSEGLRKDAERYRWLRDTLHGAKAGGGVEVNHASQVYQQPVQGEEVRIYWYLHTPVGFHDITAATIDDAIDEGMADKDPQ